MKKAVKIISVLLCLVIFFTSCKTNTNKGGFYTFKDDSNATVNLSSKPKKVAVLLSSFAEIWSLSGGKVSITVKETLTRGILDEDVLLVDDGAGKTINTEKLVSFKPDFIIGSLDLAGHKAAYDVIKSTKIPFAFFRVETFEDYLRVLKICCDINDNKEAYNKYGEGLKDDITALINKTKNKPKNKVLFLRSGSSESSLKAKSKQEHFAAKMLDDIGAINIADNVPILLDGLSVEEVIKENPKKIFVTTMGNPILAKKLVLSVFKRKEWQAVSAVKNNEIYFLSKELFQYKPNHKYYKAYKYLADILY